MPGKTILFVSHNCSLNGATAVLLELVRHWKSSANLECEFLFNDPARGELWEDFEKLGRIHLSVDSLKPTFPARFDLVFNNTFANGLLLSQLGSSSVPVLCYVHELEFAIRGMKPSVVRGTLEQTDHYIACSKAVKSVLHELFKIEEESVSVVNEFVSLRDLEESEQGKREVSSGDGAKPMPFHVGVLANMDYRKGIDRFLCMLPELPARIGSRQVRWTWCGNGASFYEKLVPRSSSEKVSFIGPTSTPWKHISGVDLLFSFAREDPFPLVNLEALARKIPVAGIRGSGGIDELEEEGYAVTCPFKADAIIKALRGFMEGENGFPEKPFLWSTEQGAPKIIEIANRFLERSLLARLSSRRPRFDFSSIGSMEAEEVRRENPSCPYDEFVLDRGGARLPSKDCVAGQSRLLFSIIVPIHKPELKLLLRAIDSVKGQVFDKWELILVDDATGDPRVTECLNELKNEDSRIKVLSLCDHRHISLCTNHGVESSRGSWIAFLDQDDELHPNALASISSFLSRNPEARIVYTDEDKIDCDGHRFDPYFKPDWNPRLLLSQNYFCHLVAVDRSLFDGLGGLRQGFEGAQDWDFCLRATGQIEDHMIGHVPEVLYHWRAHSGSTALSLDEKGDWVAEAQKKTVRSHVERSGMRGVARRTFGEHWEIVHSSGLEQAKACLVYYGPPPDARRQEIMDASLEKTNFPGLDTLVPGDWGSAVIDGYEMPELNRKLEAYDALVFIRPEIEPIHPDWLERLFSHALENGAGMVGPKLLHAASSRVVSAGMILRDGKLSSLYESLPFDFPGDKYRALLAQNLTFLHPSLLAGKTEVILPFLEGVELSAFSLSKLCERLSLAGRRNLYLPSVCCYFHQRARAFFARSEDIPYESSSGSGWHDPAFNENLCLEGGMPLPRVRSMSEETAEPKLK